MHRTRSLISRFPDYLPAQRALAELDKEREK
jgi:hypothetical protein